MQYATFDKGGTLSSFLLENIHDIPEGAVPLGFEQYYKMTQEQDGIWKINSKGEITKEPRVIDYDAIERSWRNAQLLSSDNIVARHRDQVEGGGDTTLTNDQYKALQAYRSQLRDWPASDLFPGEKSRPVAPDWLASQIE